MAVIVGMTPEQDAEAERYFKSADFYSANWGLRQARKQAAIIGGGGMLCTFTGIFIAHQAGLFGTSLQFNHEQSVIGGILALGGTLLAFAGAWLANAAEKEHCEKRLAYYRKLSVDIIE